MMSTTACKTTIQWQVRVILGSDKKIFWQLVFSERNFSIVHLCSQDVIGQISKLTVCSEMC